MAAIYDDLTALLSQAIAKSESTYRDDPERFSGWEWWQISPEETEVFDLPAVIWARTLPVYQCFDALITSTGTDGTWDDAPEKADDILDAARLKHSQWVETPDLGAFQAFAKAAAGLSFRDSHACFDKVMWQQIRDRIRTYKDEDGDGRVDV